MIYQPKQSLKHCLYNLSLMATIEKIVLDIMVKANNALIYLGKIQD